MLLTTTAHLRLRCRIYPSGPQTDAIAFTPTFKDAAPESSNVDATAKKNQSPREQSDHVIRHDADSGDGVKRRCLILPATAEAPPEGGY